MVEKIFRNSNFSDFLGIKSEINQCEILRVHPMYKSGFIDGFGPQFISRTCLVIFLLRTSVT